MGYDLLVIDRIEQMLEEDLIELKFRLYDGSDIGPIRYSSSSTVAMLKERIISEWPRGRSSLSHSHLVIFLLNFFSQKSKSLCVYFINNLLVFPVCSFSPNLEILRAYVTTDFDVLCKK